jgi:hypothetical protein
VARFASFCITEMVSGPCVLQQPLAAGSSWTNTWIDPVLQARAKVAVKQPVVKAPAFASHPLHPVVSAGRLAVHCCYINGSRIHHGVVLNAVESVQVTRQYLPELNKLEAYAPVCSSCAAWWRALAEAKPHKHDCACSSFASCSLCYCCTVFLGCRSNCCAAS